MPELSEENNNVKLPSDLVDPEEDKPVLNLDKPGLEPASEPPVRNKKVKIDLKTSQIKSGDQNLKPESGDFVVAEDEAVAKPPLYKVKLERVLGLTVPSNAAIACAPSSGVVAYPAGCTVVLYNPRKNRQSHIINAAKKTITSVGFSDDGRYLVTGECGHLPMVRIWDAHERHLVAEFPGHKFGINCVAFAPNGKYVVSVGSQHDMIVNVWDWRNNVKVASNKISTKVKAISFAENGNYFVTAGNRHVKFWYLEYSRSKYKEPVPLMGRSAILGEQRNNYFCDVACGRGEMGDSTFAITKSGLLCEFNNRRLLDKWVELRTQSANCLVVGEDFVFIGCADGIVRCFSPHTMQFITTLPRTHYLGVDVSKGLTISHMASHPPDARYPDATAITYDEQNFKVTVVYNDHSVYVWDVRDIKKVGKSHSFIFHSACIWGLETYPSTGDDQKPVLPPGSFITCSSDDTIRIWNLNHNMATNTLYKRNIYSDELLKTIYVDTDLNYIKEADTSNPEGGPKETYDQRNGVRCIRISHDGKQLASGDRAGNIRIHELQFMDELCKIEAHDAEVLCLEYSGRTVLVSDPAKTHSTKTTRTVSFLASASRDRLIHVFDAGRDYSFLHTLDDHSSSITAVRFLRGQVSPGGQAHPESSIQMVSCGADKSIIFRDIGLDKRGLPEFQRGNHVVGKTTLYDMDIDHNHKHVLTACQDRNIRVYTVANGKHSRTFKGSAGEDGTLIKVALDRSGMYAATSCTDKTLAIYDYINGECMATMFGHSELVTGLKFSNDCKHLISVSGDGCIFVWRLPQEMTANMLARLAQLGQPAKSRAYISGQAPPVQPEFIDTSEGIPNGPIVGNENDYRFSIGKLPVWAKKQIFERAGSLTPPSPPPTALQKGGPPTDFPKGRWGQRVGVTGGQSMTVKSHYDSDSIIPFPPTPPDSKESSSLEGVRRGSSGPSAKQGFYDDNGEDYNSFSEVENYQRGQSPYQSRVTFKEESLLSVGQRQRAVTDDSSLGSFNVDLNEHDADIDEFSDGLTTQDDGGESTEPEHTENTLFFGQDEEMPSAYTVNATDVEELKRSQRRSKKVTGGRAIDRLTNEVLTTPSQESDFDDEEDDLSTPSADQSEKNILSMLSVSSENVDLVGRRERFMQSNFESLSAAELDAPGANNHIHNSISNQYREGSAVQRNAVTIARAQSLRDNAQNRRREELQKRIEETRKKLQTIGYRSIMRGSQSISDLSNIHDNTFNQIPQERPNSSASHGYRGNKSSPNSNSKSDRASSCTASTRVSASTSIQNNHNVGNSSRPGSTEPSMSHEESGLRRACSLSDLNKPRRLLPAPPVSVSGKKSIPDHRSSSHDPRKMSVPSFTPSPTSDDVPSYMRSTSASTKKERQTAPQALTSQQRRRSSVGLAQSTSDLRSVAKDVEEDTSSEENLGSGHGNRRRSSSSCGGSQDRIAMANASPRRSVTGPTHVTNLMNSMTRSERDLSKVTKVRVRTNTKENAASIPATFIKQRTKMKTTTMIVSDGSTPTSTTTSTALQTTGNRDLDVVRAPLNWHLAESTAIELQKASDNLVQLYKRISLDYDLEEGPRKELLHKLASTAGVAQQTLRPVVPAGYALSHGDFANAAMASINQILSKQGKALTGPGNTTTVNVGNGDSPSDDLTASAELRNNPYFQHMIENYSNLIYQQQQQQIQQQQQQQQLQLQQRGSPQAKQSPSRSSSNGAGTRPTNQGPSWC